MQKYATGQMLLGQWKDGHKYVCFIQSQSNTDKGHLCIVFFFWKRAHLLIKVYEYSDLLTVNKCAKFALVCN